MNLFDWLIRLIACYNKFGPMFRSNIRFKILYFLQAAFVATGSTKFFQNLIKKMRFQSKEFEEFNNFAFIQEYFTDIGGKSEKLSNINPIPLLLLNRWWGIILAPAFIFLCKILTLNNFRILLQIFFFIKQKLLKTMKK